MDYIKGKYKSSIYTSTNGYVVGLFRVKEASENLDDIVNKTITFTGYFPEINNDELYVFNGKYTFHDRYGYQFQVDSYEKILPTEEDAIIEFLTSSFVSGCGEQTAKKIVSVLGSKAISLIKEDKSNLDKVGLSASKTTKIYNSIMNYYDQDELIIYLKSLDFSVKEISKLMNIYGKGIKSIVLNDLYSLIDIVDFNKLDKIFFKIYEETNDMRILACIIESIKRLSFENGDTFVYKEEIYEYMLNTFKIDLYDMIDEYLEMLKNTKDIIIKGNKYYLTQTYVDEVYIASSLKEIDSHDAAINITDDDFKDIEHNFNITYNDEQKEAIKLALNNSLTIITGGPGTGKTTIINGLLHIYQSVLRLTNLQMNNFAALLAPTGRASKRMSETTNFGAMTIHRYLKWNHETKEFGVNEYNKNEHRLIIIDEASMIDNELMANLLRGIDHYTKLVLVGDEFQLPSVGPGNVLKDIIDSDMFCHIKLKSIYRQSENSFIPILAKEIKEKNIESNIKEKKDDYNFLDCNKENLKVMLTKIIDKCLDKGLNEKNIQVLAPMYKGENGIDNLNIILQDIFNPPSSLESVHIGPIIYRVNDKVINLINNVDNNIFNGDIGYIKDVNPKNSNEFLTIDFYGNEVVLKRDEVGQIKHAYAMSIHKSQGSEFDHVIMPLTKEFSRMLYNKLLYTGVSRAKKSLVIIGSDEAFMYAVNNTYSLERKTNLLEEIKNKFK